MITIETTSGATYEVDLETMHIRRHGPRAETDPDKPDGEWLAIVDAGTPVPGKSMWFMFRDGRVRTTTAVSRVVAR